MRKSFFVLFAVCLLFCLLLRATTTMKWEVSSFEDFEKGEFEGTSLDSHGEIKSGWSSVMMKLPEDASVWSYAEDSSGGIFFGTGNRGIIYLLKGSEVYEVFDTESVIITSLVFDGAGNLYAAGIPGAAIYKFSRKQIKKQLRGLNSIAGSWVKDEQNGEKKAEEVSPVNMEDKKKKPNQQKPWLRLKDVEHIWSMMYNARRKILFVGTGSKGRIYSVDPTGRANVYVDIGEEHVFSLTTNDKGELIAGTGNRGKLFRIYGAGRAEVLWDFEATEVRGVVYTPVAGEKKGYICAVNKFKAVPPISTFKPSLKKMTKPTPKQTIKSSADKGEGKISAIVEGEGERVLLELKKTHFKFITPGTKGEVFVGEAQKGRIYRVDMEGNYSIIFDLHQRQALCFCFSCSNPFIGTSDPPTVHRVLMKEPTSPLYISKVFDAGTTGRWGMMVIRGRGRVYWQTRSGNTKKVDKWWSEWSGWSSKPEGKINSREGRFFQFRLKVPPDSVVWNVAIYYLPVNRPPIVKEIIVGEDSGSSSRKKESKVKKKDSEKKQKERYKLKIKWKVENPDNDELRYELYFAREGEGIWMPILKEDELLSKKEYEWDISSVPPGHYLIKVVAIDDPENDPAFALSHERVSRPILIDNQPPGVEFDVKIKNSSVYIKGTARDEFSKITDIQYSIDGGRWREVFPVDLIFDQKEEKFQFKVDDLTRSAHTITVRAVDECGNFSSAGRGFVLK